jgi:cytochrome oxidase assembly protein ShyY1
LILVILAAVFLRLGNWQLERKAEKQVLFDRFENAPALGIEQAIDGDEQFARVKATGRFDPVRHVLIDNRVWKGRAGVHVFTPFTLAGGRHILVNRGWLPLPPDRSYLPEVPTPAGEQVISGRLNRLPLEGPRLGEADVLSADEWPQLVTYFETGAVEDALGLTLVPWLIQLNPDEPAGFEDRQWRAAVMEPKTHGAYAVQWFSLLIATISIWLILGFRRGRRPGRPANPGDRDSNGAKEP